MCVIPFRKPGVAPITEEEFAAFDQLEDTLYDHELSRAVGWAVQLKQTLLNKEEVRRVRALLAGTFQGRSAHNWSLLLLCAEKVGKF